MKKLILIAAALLTMTAAATAQNTTMYGAMRIPQSNALNPAFFPSDSRVYVSLLSTSINFQLPTGLNGLVYDTIVNGQKFNKINVNNIIDAMQNNSQINIGFDQGLIGFGFRFGKNFITFSSGLKSTFNVGLPFHALSVLTEGNTTEDGKPRTVDVSTGDLVNAQVYTEFGIGFARKFFKNLTLGLKVKPIVGLANISTPDTKAQITTSEDFNNMNAVVDYTVRMAMPLTLRDGQAVKDAFKDIEFAGPTSAGTGLGIDIGAKYEWHHFEFSASIIDMGRINWKNVYELNPEDEQQFSFGGVMLADYLEDGSINGDSIGAQYKEQLEALQNARVSKGASFHTGLHTKLNMGAFYRVPLAGVFQLRAGLLLHGEFAPRMAQSLEEYSSRIFRRNITVMADANLANWLELTLSNTMVNNGYEADWFNPGIGFNLMLGKVMQFYFLMDYMSSFNFRQNKEFSILMGTNIIIGAGKALLPDVVGDAFDYRIETTNDYE